MVHFYHTLHPLYVHYSDRGRRAASRIHTRTRIIFIKAYLHVHLFMCVRSPPPPPLPVTRYNNYYHGIPRTHNRPRTAAASFRRFSYTPAAARRTFVSVCVSAAAATADDDDDYDIQDYDDGAPSRPAPEPLPPGFPSRIRAHDARALSSLFLSPLAGRRPRRLLLPLARSRYLHRPSRSLFLARPCRTRVASTPVQASSRAFTLLTDAK